MMPNCPYSPSIRQVPGRVHCHTFGESGDFAGAQEQAVGGERVAQGAAVPLRVRDAQRFEQAWDQEVTQVLSVAAMDDPPEQVGVRTPVPEDLARRVEHRGGEERAHRVAAVMASGSSQR